MCMCLNHNSKISWYRAHPNRTAYGGYWWNGIVYIIDYCRWWVLDENNECFPSMTYWGELKPSAPSEMSDDVLMQIFPFFVQSECQATGGTSFCSIWSSIFQMCSRSGLMEGRETNDPGCVSVGHAHQKPAFIRSVDLSDNSSVSNRISPKTMPSCSHDEYQYTYPLLTWNLHILINS